MTDLIDWQDILDRCVKEETAIAILQIWVEDGPELIRRLAEAVEQGHTEAISRCAHEVKGSAATIGAKGLARLAYQLESMDVTDDRAAVEARFAEIRRLCHLIQTLLAQADWVDRVKRGVTGSVIGDPSSGVG